MEHKGTKRIETERLTLRPFRVEDAEAMHRNWASDEEVTRFLTWPPHESVEETAALLTNWCGKYESADWYQWAIVPKTLNEPIGSISAVKVNDDTRSADIGYCMGKAWWGQGLMPEALGAVIAFFFDEVEAGCVTACHAPENPKSGRVMQKCGMHYDGTLRHAGRNNQGICDEVWYSILKEEYDRRKSGSDIWDYLYARALAVQNDRTVSPFIEAGGVAAAILTKAGHTYVGVCIDTASTLGMCGERNAIANMLTNGESQIAKVVAVMPDGGVGSPCGACREYMMQLDKDSGDIEILLDLETKKTVRLKKLIPDWWGYSRFEQAERNERS